MNETPDLFVSYRRKNAASIEALVAALHPLAFLTP